MGCYEWFPPLPVAVFGGDTWQPRSLEYVLERDGLGCLVGCYEWFPPLPVAASGGDTWQLRSLKYVLERDGRVLKLQSIKGVINIGRIL